MRQRQVVVGDARIQVVHVVKADVAREEVEHLRRRRIESVLEKDRQSVLGHANGPTGAFPIAAKSRPATCDAQGRRAAALAGS